MKMSKSIININEDFPHLSNAPIVEAVFDIRLVPKTQWDEKQMEDELKKRLSGYPKFEPIRQSEFQFSAGKTDAVVRDHGCIGFKLHSKDSRYVVQFQKSQFVISRLKPYEKWVSFTKEALSLWRQYAELFNPGDIKRMGVRFINRIVLPDGKIVLGDYYKVPPQSLEGSEGDWPLTGFLHQDIIQVPGTPYQVSLRKTIQSTTTGIGKETGLILDIDVFMQSPFEYTEKEILKYWEEMRWVKNTVFFNSLTEKAIEEFK